jgi:hypothetical protein
MDRSTQKVLQVLLDRHKIEQASAGFHLHKDVHITGLAGGPFGKRAKQSNLQGSMLAGNPDDVFPVSF